ncbi:MAG TPA: hypothetical protein VHB79_39095 [Polyangiaceae bacterium]|nr:hypothetical protein [Polyangiaceae bacterium]
MKRLLAAALVALGALGPASSWGEEAQRDYVVLLLPEHESPTSLRLKAEVQKLHLAVHVAQTDEPVDPDEPRMAELARTFGGEALVVLSSDGRVATIWFSHAGQGEKLKRVVQAESGSPDLRSESVVVGTVELLRVRLLTRREPEPEPAPPPPPPPLPPPASPPPAPPYRPLTIGAVVGLDKAGSKFSFGSSYQLSLDFQVLEPVSVRGLVRLPAASSQTSLNGATAELQSVLAAGGLALGFNPTPALRLDAYAGAGAAHVVAQGFSPPGMLAATRQQSKWLFVGVGGARAAFEIAPILNVTAQAGVAVSGVPVEIVIDGQTAAVWGRPSLFSGIGLELRPNFRGGG